jgi:hypothetical protein
MKIDAMKRVHRTAPVPLFSAADRASLQRLAIASLGMLHAEIEGQCEGLEKAR